MLIAVLMACHNRRTKTVSCLRALRRSLERCSDINIHVFLTEDGCTDGTSDAVQRLNVPLTVIHGDGSLYWNGGMSAAWRAAECACVAFDAFLLLNDDTVFDPDGLGALLSVSHELDHESIVVGAVRSPDSGALTYGGVRRLSAWHPARVQRLEVSETIQDADTFNGNCALIPASVYRKIGILDPTYTHAMGDFDYGFRARAAGCRVVVAPGTVGTCERNSVRGSWQDPRLPLWRRLRLLESPKGLPRRQWIAFLRSHGARRRGCCRFHRAYE